MWTSKQDLSCCGCLQLEWWIWSKQPGHALCRTCGLGTRLTKTFEANTGTLKQPSLVNSLTCHHYLTGGSHQWSNVTKKSKNIAVKNYSIFLYVVWPGYAGFMGHFWPMGERLRPLADSKQDKTEIVLTTVPLWFYFYHDTYMNICSLRCCCVPKRWRRRRRRRKKLCLLMIQLQREHSWGESSFVTSFWHLCDKKYFLSCSVSDLNLKYFNSTSEAGRGQRSGGEGAEGVCFGLHIIRCTVVREAWLHHWWQLVGKIYYILIYKM